MTQEATMRETGQRYASANEVLERSIAGHPTGRKIVDIRDGGVWGIQGRYVDQNGVQHEAIGSWAYPILSWYVPALNRSVMIEGRWLPVSP